MISQEETKHIAELARIGMSDDELERFSQDLSSVLDWIKKMEEADVTEVLPTAHIAGVKNIKREDREADFSDKEKLIELFPDKKDRYDKVKSVM